MTAINPKKFGNIAIGKISEIIPKSIFKSLALKELEIQSDYYFLTLAKYNDEEVKEFKTEIIKHWKDLKKDINHLKEIAKYLYTYFPYTDMDPYEIESKTGYDPLEANQEALIAISSNKEKRLKPVAIKKIAKLIPKDCFYSICIDHFKESQETFTFLSKSLSEMDDSFMELILKRWTYMADNLEIDQKYRIAEILYQSQGLTSIKNEAIEAATKYRKILLDDDSTDFRLEKIEQKKLSLLSSMPSSSRCEMPMEISEAGKKKECKKIKNQKSVLEGSSTSPELSLLILSQVAKKLGKQPKLKVDCLTTYGLGLKDDDIEEIFTLHGKANITQEKSIFNILVNWIHKKKNFKTAYADLCNALRHEEVNIASEEDAIAELLNAKKYTKTKK